LTAQEESKKAARKNETVCKRNRAVSFNVTEGMPA